MGYNKKKWGIVFSFFLNNLETFTDSSPAEATSFHYLNDRLTELRFMVANHRVLHCLCAVFYFNFSILITLRLVDGNHLYCLFLG